MAKKKKGKRGGGRSDKPRAAGDDFEDQPPVFDRRAMEGILHGFLPELGLEGSTPTTPLGQAQEVMYEAFEAQGEEKLRLARKALSISADCADAYVLLAEHTSRLAEALRLYEQGLAAGERSLGREAFQEYQGRFWGILETRPYMRARLGLAQSLWELGRREEAVGHYRDMLRLNPDDNQGVRYVLAACLLDLGRHEDLARLLSDYRDDDSTESVYTKALLAYRKEGDSDRARKLASRAAKGNRHVPAYLLGIKPMPRELSEYVTSGGEDEAVGYVVDFLSGWRSTPSALGWLRKTLKVPIGPGRKERKPSWPELRLALRRLPQEEGEAWHVDCWPLPTTAQDPDADFPQWLLVVADTANGTVVDLDFAEEEPTQADLWDYLVATMLQPKEGEPRRPQSVQAPEEVAAKWRTRLKQIDVVFSERGREDDIDRLMEIARPAIANLVGRLEQSGAGLPGSDPAELPQRPGEVWQADIRKFPGWVGNQGEPSRPWVAIVTNPGEDLVMGHDLRIDPPDADWFREALYRAMAEPAIGEPHRPGIIEFGSSRYGEAVRPDLEAAGIRCVVREELDHLDFVLKNMAEHLGGQKPLAALMEVPGMPPEQVGRFLDAAAEFYRRAPWRDVPGDTPIRIECDKFKSGPWYAVVMGQQGMTLGLALYEDLDALRSLLKGRGSDEANSRRMSGLSVMYGEAFDIPIADLDAAEKHRWAVAAPEAYPQAIRVNPGRAVRPALPWELELLEGSLRAIPAFLVAKIDSQTQVVPTAKGEITVRLARLADVGP